MQALTPWPKTPIEEDGLAMLDGLLKAWCEETSHEMGSAQSQKKARELVDWYEFGIRDVAELRTLIREA